MPKQRKYKSVEDWIERNEKRYRRSISRRVRGWLNVVRMRIGTAYLGDQLSVHIIHHDDGLTEFRLVDTKRRYYYGPWYVKYDFLDRVLLCRSPLYEPKIPTYRPTEGDGNASLL